MPDYAGKVHHDGPDKQVVESGGELAIESGGELDIESGGALKLAGAQVTASAAELNVMDGVTASTDEINSLDGMAITGDEQTIGDQAGDVINVAVQLESASGGFDYRTGVFVYLSDSQYGLSLAATAPDGGWAIGTDGVLIPVVTGKAAYVVANGMGQFDIDITESGSATWYLIVVKPDGKIDAAGSSNAITFTA